MCEINPKRTKIFRLEFFTSHSISEKEWNTLVVERLLELEQAFNATSQIRVHIHPSQEDTRA